MSTRRALGLIGIARRGTGSISANASHPTVKNPHPFAAGRPISPKDSVGRYAFTV